MGVGNGMICDTEDLLAMLDSFLTNRGRSWWDAFYTEATAPSPFPPDCPDETLVDDFQCGFLRPGRVLELGCGNGRNALYMAGLGCTVDAIDFSAEAIAQAEQRKPERCANVNFIKDSIFSFVFPNEAYDVIYDSGCFHHVAPHRRPTYVERAHAALKPRGNLSVVYFGPDGGSGLSDREVYERRTLGGGLGYADAQILKIFETRFDVLKIRPMQDMPAESPLFGKSFLRSARMRKKKAA